MLDAPDRLWARLLAERQAEAEATSTAGMSLILVPPAVTEPQLKAFEAALEQEIQCMLQDGLPHVLSTSYFHVCHPLCRAAEASGISAIRHRFPDQIIMRIFPNTIMVHRGSYATVEIVWSTDKTTYGNQSTHSTGYGDYGKVATSSAEPSSSTSSAIGLLGGQSAMSEAL